MFINCIVAAIILKKVCFLPLCVIKYKYLKFRITSISPVHDLRLDGGFFLV